nr:MAG TPA: hypothetical protein [Caudoviricetes sp.]
MFFIQLQAPPFLKNRIANCNKYFNMLLTSISKCNIF